MSKEKDYRRYTQADLDAAVQEAFTIGRIYTRGGETESPRAIQAKLRLSVGQAIQIERAHRRKYAR